MQFHYKTILITGSTSDRVELVRALAPFNRFIVLTGNPAKRVELEKKYSHHMLQILLLQK